MASGRKLAVKALLKINTDSAYSNLTLNSVFKESDASTSDKALATALVYGVLDRKITLDYVLGNFLKTPLKKVAPFTKEVLRTALYQIMFMDKIPDSAAVDEAVKLVKTSKESRNSGFVNAVLRNVLRAENLLPNGDSLEDLSVIYSCPTDIIRSFTEDYGIENTKKLLSESLKPAEITVRVNTIKTNVEEFENLIGVETQKTDIDGGLILKSGIDISQNELYKDGLFYVQDLASQKAVKVLDPKPDTRLLDMCAAPGGKSFTMALLMQNKGEIVSCDLYEKRVELIEKSAKRLGLDIINPKVSDATVYDGNLGEFDYILCDVPCSGLGVIRRKPDIKYKDFTEFDSLCEIQAKILNNAVKYLKKGGKILYSTCTLRKKENDDIVNNFLGNNKDFVCEFSHTFMPHTDGTDGFYCALLKNNS